MSEAKEKDWIREAEDELEIALELGDSERSSQRDRAPQREVTAQVYALMAIAHELRLLRQIMDLHEIEHAQEGEQG